MRCFHLAIICVGLGFLQACDDASSESPPHGETGDAGRDATSPQKESGAPDASTVDAGARPDVDASSPAADGGARPDAVIADVDASSPAIDGGARPDAVTADVDASSPTVDGGAGSDVATRDAADGTPPDGTIGCPPFTGAADAGAPTAIANLVPLPVSVTSAGGRFLLSSGAAIRVDRANAEMTAIGEYLAGKLRPATGYALPVASASSPCAGDIVLAATGASTLGSEGYDLAITPTQVSLSAYQPAGIFRGVQTLRQLLPASIESASMSAGPWIVATGTIHDLPRFAWRGAMLDVARHFFQRAVVESYIDLLAYYKINTFHLHLSDDQGWRIHINSWPDLTKVGGSSQVGGGAGGFYSQADYMAIVAYAKSRYITVIPEIDMPGHTNAALSSYGVLNCNGMPAPPYTGMDVPGSSLCISDPDTIPFVSDVIREVSAITPSPYFHVGGDEASNTSPGDYQTFFSAVQPIVQMAGKQLVGWDAVGRLSSLPPGSIIQYWDPTSAGSAAVASAAGRGVKVLASLASKAYLDQKYNASTPLGLNWAGPIDERVAYEWDPASLIPGVTDAELVGIESPLWTETLATLADLQFMAFPRVAGHAEIGWSPRMGRTWTEYRVRIGSHGPRLRALGVNYYSSTLIPWQ